MGVVAMHNKSDSDATSIDATSSPPRPLYFVQSPSQHDKNSTYGYSSPFSSPPHHHHQHYHCSPVHHSRESSTSRFSASHHLIVHKSHSSSGGGGGVWRRLYTRGEKGEEEEEGDDVDGDDDVDGAVGMMRFYVMCFVLSFAALFSVFALVLWAVATTYPPQISVKEMVFLSFNVQSGSDHTGVPTTMMTLNSTVRIFYRNPATFFGVHVSSTSLELSHYQLKVATGHMKKFYQSRKSQRPIVTAVFADKVPLYGGIPLISSQINHIESVTVPLNLTFVMRSRAYVLGRLVKPTFYQRIRCRVNLRGGKHLGKRLNMTKFCIFNE